MNNESLLEKISELIASKLDEKLNPINAKLSVLDKRQQEQGKDIVVLKEGMVTLDKRQQEQGKDIVVLKDKMTMLERVQNQILTLGEATYEGLKDKATKGDIEQMGDFIVIKVLKRLDSHDERIESLEKELHVLHKN